MLCDKCQTRDATVYWTACTDVGGEEPTSIQLCRECFEASDLAGVGALPPTETVSQARCRYCGGEPVTGRPDRLSGQVGGSTWVFMCKPCAEEYFGVLQKQFPGFGDPDRTKDQLAVLISKAKSYDFRTVFADLEKHMEQWAGKRKTR